MLAGSVGERADGEERIFNTSCLIDRSGEVVATYRKIHMFDVDVGGVRYEESARSSRARRSSAATSTASGWA